MSKTKTKSRSFTPAEARKAGRTALAKRPQATAPSLGQVVDEVRKQREDIRRIAASPTMAFAFCQELAATLRIAFTGDEEDFQTMREALALNLALIENATELDHFIGRLNMAFGGAGNVNQNDVIDAVRCYRNLVNELLVEGSQPMLDHVRELKRKAAIAAQLTGATSAVVSGAVVDWGKRESACYCSDYLSSGVPCPPGECPNVPKVGS